MKMRFLVLILLFAVCGCTGSATARSVLWHWSAPEDGSPAVTYAFYISNGDTLNFELISTTQDTTYQRNMREDGTVQYARVIAIDAFGRLSVPSRPSDPFVDEGNPKWGTAIPKPRWSIVEGGE